MNAQAALGLGALIALLCLPAGCKGSACSKDTDCARGLICKKNSDTPGVCIQGCRSDSDCNDGFICDRSECVRQGAMSRDAGVRPDLGVAVIPDAGQRDSGIYPDAAEPIDAGIHPDAEPIDAFILGSDDLLNDGTFPVEFTCLGADTQPELHWSGAGFGIIYLALVDDDLDLVHWVAEGLTTTERLPRGASSAMTLPAQWSELENTYCATRTSTVNQMPKYCGPCPPAGPAHHYSFRAYTRGGIALIGGLPSASSFESSLMPVATARLRASFAR